MLHLKTFQNLCGAEVLKNVVLVTTMWDEVDEELGNDRESELITRYWKTMIELGSRTSRFYNNTESALDIVSQFQDARCTVLLQKELVDLNLELAETSAGGVLCVNRSAETRTRTRWMKILSGVGFLATLGS